jgi:hypothetical protein
MDREELKRLTEEEMGRRIQEGVKAVIEQVLEGGDAKGHGGLGFPALPGHGPALGRGRETHKNRDLTDKCPDSPNIRRCSVLPPGPDWSIPRV